MTKISEQQEIQERAKVLQEYQTLKKSEDLDLRSYLSTQNRQMMDESLFKKQEVLRRELVEDLERIKQLKVSSDEEARRKLQEKIELYETQNKFLEYRGKIRENEKLEEH